MSTAKKKAIILPLVFIAALVIGMMRAPEKAPAEEEGSTMNAASLPVLCASLGDRLIDPLYGYTEEMDAAGLMDSVYPFTDSLTMKVTLLGGTTRPKSVTYEIRDEQGERLIERGSAGVFEGSRSECSFSFSLYLRTLSRFCCALICFPQSAQYLVVLGFSAMNSLPHCSQVFTAL